jgi:hypothetical protein
MAVAEHAGATGKFELSEMPWGEEKTPFRRHPRKTVDITNQISQRYPISTDLPFKSIHKKHKSVYSVISQVPALYPVPGEENSK